MKGFAYTGISGSSAITDTCVNDTHSIEWNGVHFAPALPPFRVSKIVRLRPQRAFAPAAQQAPEPPEARVQIWEHHIELISPEITLLIISNAPEAAEELPDFIATSFRNIGTFRDAKLTWRGRDDVCFVSASVTNASIRATLERDSAHQPDPVATQIATLSTIARNSMRSGLHIGGSEFTRGWTPEEIEFANLLMECKNPDTGEVFSFAELGQILGCSDETARRRQIALVAKFPRFKRILAACRSRNAKGQNLGPRATDGDDDEQPETDRDND